VMRLKNAWMIPLCVACMIVDGQTLPEPIRSHATREHVGGRSTLAFKSSDQLH
jgi:hypothetical protein